MNRFFKGSLHNVGSNKQQWAITTSASTASSVFVFGLHVISGLVSDNGKKSTM